MKIIDFLYLHSQIYISLCVDKKRKLRPKVHASSLEMYKVAESSQDGSKRKVLSFTQGNKQEDILSAKKLIRRVDIWPRSVPQRHKTAFVVKRTVV